MKTAGKRTIDREHATEAPENERRPEVGFLVFMIVVLVALIIFSGFLSSNVGGSVNAAALVSQANRHTGAEAGAPGTPRRVANAALTGQGRNEPESTP